MFIKKKLNQIFEAAGIKPIRFKDYLNVNTKKIATSGNRATSKQRIELSGKAVFFGYHDKTPFSVDNSKVLVNVVEGTGNEPASDKILMKTGYFSLGNDGIPDQNFIEIGETTTWNWQQGCMLQWDPQAPNSRVFFNRKVNGEFGSVLYDIEKKLVIHEYPFPIYSICPNGKYALTLNFQRLGVIKPAYGYPSHIKKEDVEYVPKDDGLWLYNLENTDYKPIALIDELADFTGRDSYQYLNHATFSPDGKSLVFFHVFTNATGKRSIRFYWYQIKTGQKTLLEAEDNVSHYCWKNECEILTAENHLVNTGYYLYNLKKRIKSKIPLVNVGDIHPMFHPTEKQLLLADTRPDKKGYQHLMIFNVESNDVQYLGAYHSPETFIHDRRCDLHPRWSKTGNYISIDTAETGYRSMVILKTE